MKKKSEQAKSRFILPRLLTKAFAELRRGDPMRMAGATAFFTTFALPPIFIILFQLLSIFLNDRQLGKEMMDMLTDTFGRQGASQIRQTSRGIRTLAQNWYLTIGGFIFLVFVATTLFTVIKNTLNDIWNIKITERAGILFNLWVRIKSLGAIVITGLLFVASMMLDGLEVILGKNIEQWWPEASAFFEGAFDEVISLLIVTAWFMILFRYLADGRPSRKAVLAGGFLTAVLFTGGKMLLSTFIINSNIGPVYGPSASIVLVLLFVFYSSFILYYGASFIKVYSDAIRRPIEPVNDKAYRYRLSKVVSTVSTSSKAQDQDSS